MPDDYFRDHSPFGATFLVEIDGHNAGQFREVSGLEINIEFDEIMEGGQNGYVHKLPGRMTWPNIVLSRGVTQSDLLVAWAQETSGEAFASSGNKLRRATVAITMTSSQGKRLRTWEVEGAFPIRWTGPQFSSDSNDQLVEELEIAHHGFKVEQLW